MQNSRQAIQKLKQYAVVSSPILIPLVLLFLSKKYPVVDSIATFLFIAAVAWIAYTFWKVRKVLADAVNGHNLSAALINFSIYETSYEEYGVVRRKVEAFVIALENGQDDVGLALEPNEINCLRTKGKTPTKSSNEALRMPEYYEIREGELYEYEAMFFPFSASGYDISHRKINFSVIDGSFLELKTLVQQNSKTVPLERQVTTASPILKSKLLNCIFCLDKTLDWQESMALVIGKLKQIEVINGKLTLRA